MAREVEWLAVVRHDLFATLHDQANLDAASAEYRTAASRTTSVPEQHYLTTQAARLNERH